MGLPTTFFFRLLDRQTLGACENEVGRVAWRVGGVTDWGAGPMELPVVTLCGGFNMSTRLNSEPYYH